MEFDLKTISYVIGGVVSIACALTAFAMKNPDAYSTVIEPRLEKIIGLLWAWSFGAQMLGFYVHMNVMPLIDPAKAKEREAVLGTMWLLAVSGMMLALALFAMQLWLHGIARDGRKLKPPVESKE